MRRIAWSFGLGLSLMLATSSMAAAQTPLSEILVRLIQADVILAPPPAGALSHSAHFVPGEQERIAPYLFNSAILSQLTTFPIGSSSGGFTYTFDPTVGSFTRAASSFGPAFAERALTIGRGKFSLGANYQYSSYNTFEGKDLKDGSIKFYLQHAPTGGAFFEGDVIQTALNLSLTTNTFVMFANYGATDRLDVGIAVPVISVKMDATVNATVLRFATAGANPPIHQFQNGTDSNTFHAAGSATGIGDILLRAKYRFYDTKGGGLAGGLDLRLPTGDQANLLGSGAAQGKVLLVGSTTYDRFAPHVNVGYTFSGSSNSPFFTPASEVNYTVGTEIVASPRVTVNADFVGRTLRNLGRLQEQPRTFTFFNPFSNTNGSTTVQEFALQSGSLNLLMGAGGVKFNPAANLLISANLLFPLTQAGIRARVTPVIGVDYAF
ncbi:MAG TPA: hypothetical protein VL309_11565 [Vicinamibacterales bacterium]|nr:hypothetical protein [Vicinamibacterales bacterium]